MRRMVIIQTSPLPEDVDQPHFLGLLHVSFGLCAVSFGLLAISFGLENAVSLDVVNFSSDFFELFLVNSLTPRVVSSV